MSDDDLAVRLACRAGAVLMDLRRDSQLRGPALGASGDLVANAVLMDALAEARPGEAVLSEEAPDDTTRLDRHRVWIVDPLDGSREYGEGRDDFAVHVALAVDGEAICGAVALPALGEIYSTLEPPSLGWMHGPPLRVVVSRTRPPGWLGELAAALQANVVAMGSMGAKAMAVVRGEADVYVHGGGQREWDSAAPVAVARCAGLHTSSLDARPLPFNRRDVVQEGLLICRPELSSRVLDVLARVRGGSLE